MIRLRTLFVVFCSVVFFHLAEAQPGGDPCNCSPNYCQAFVDVSCSNSAPCSDSEISTFAVPCTREYAWVVSLDNCNPATEACGWCIKVYNMVTGALVLHLTNVDGSGNCIEVALIGEVSLICENQATYKVDIALTNCPDGSHSCEDCDCQLKFQIKTDKYHAGC